MDPKTQTKTGDALVRLAVNLAGLTDRDLLDVASAVRAEIERRGMHGPARPVIH